MGDMSAGDGYGRVCDACHSARATWLVVFPTGSCLRLCGHHLSKHKHALQARQATLVSLSEEPK